MIWIIFNVSEEDDFAEPVFDILHLDQCTPVGAFNLVVNVTIQMDE
jgi:hypothetical protein